MTSEDYTQLLAAREEELDALTTRPRRWEGIVLDLVVDSAITGFSLWVGEEVTGDEGKLRQDLADALAHASSGYEAARRLEDAGYEPDTELVQFMDAVIARGYHVYNLVTDRWARRVGVVVYAPGTQVRLNLRSGHFEELQPDVTWVIIHARPGLRYCITSRGNEQSPGMMPVVDHEELVVVPDAPLLPIRDES